MLRDRIMKMLLLNFVVFCHLHCFVASLVLPKTMHKIAQKIPKSAKSVLKSQKHSKRGGGLHNIVDTHPHIAS